MTTGILIFEEKLEKGRLCLSQVEEPLSREIKIEQSYSVSTEFMSSSKINAF